MKTTEVKKKGTTLMAASGASLVIDDRLQVKITNTHTSRITFMLFILATKQGTLQRPGFKLFPSMLGNRTYVGLVLISLVFSKLFPVCSVGLIEVVRSKAC
jgi:hypothetical protein